MLRSDEEDEQIDLRVMKSNSLGRWEVKRSIVKRNGRRGS